MLNNKTLLVSIGIGVAFFFAAIWAYLLLFGTPKAVDEVFVDLGVGGNEYNGEGTVREFDPDAVVDPATNNGTQVNVSGGLEQLTLRPVAGYVHLVEGAQNVVRYAERGTGHIYEINLNTGQERKLSNTTLTKVIDADFSPLGTQVALSIQSGFTKNVSLLNLATTSGAGSPSNLVNLPAGSDHLHFLSEESLEYGRVVDGKTVGYRRNLVSSSELKLWEIPLTDIIVHWRADATYVVNRSAPYLEGNVYQINSSGNLERLHEPLFTYTATVSYDSSNFLETYYNLENRQLLTRNYNQVSEGTVGLPILGLPEKCDFDPTEPNLVWCGSPFLDEINRDREYLRDWYSGTVTSDDMLWVSDITDQSSTLAVNLFSEAGFVIDVIDLSVSEDGDSVFFVNKLNDALWRYQIEWYDLIIY